MIVTVAGNGWVETITRDTAARAGMAAKARVDERAPRLEERAEMRAKGHPTNSSTFQPSTRWWEGHVVECRI